MNEKLSRNVCLPQEKKSYRSILKETIEITKRRSSRQFNLFILSVIIISLLGHCLDTLPNLSFLQRNILSWVEWVCIVLFTIEYILRFFVSTRKLKFMISFYGVIDLLSIAPSFFFISYGFGSIRIIRVFNLLKIFRLLQFISALDHLKRSLYAVKDELLLFFILAIIMIYFSSAGIYFFEHEAQPEKFSSIIHSLWWSIVTMSTVGYGDVYPITVGGKIFSSFIILIGISFVAIPTGIFSASLSKIKIKNYSKRFPKGNNN